MSEDLESQEAADAAEALGLWMDLRHNSGGGIPIQSWNIPPKEKLFFTIYAMNLVLESDGFDGLLEQPPADVEAFIALLDQVRADQTAYLVRRTVAALKNNRPCDANACTDTYLDLFEHDQVWPKVMHSVGRRLVASYALKARAIEQAGGSSADPRQWQGELPIPKRWWEFWK